MTLSLGLVPVSLLLLPYAPCLCGRTLARSAGAKYVAGTCAGRLSEGSGAIVGLSVSRGMGEPN